MHELWPIPGTLDAVVNDIIDILIYSFKYEYVIKEDTLKDVFDLKWILPVLAIYKGRLGCCNRVVRTLKLVNITLELLIKLFVKKTVFRWLIAVNSCSSRSTRTPLSVLLPLHLLAKVV